MALKAKWVSSAQNEVTPATGSKVFDRIQVINDTKFHTLTVETGFTDDGLAVANANEVSATSIAPGLYEGRWVAIKIHSGLIRLYEGF